ncbi:uncharacterized protein LOC123228956 [Mangifera indica]|uniref:uncharacterized protein LOC123228956 n=1 Tax=Mangifera indica TaxID=29780 RepID=UPI001CFAE570|nr:uncharacterized protein LOC123228956 [Mangifera indica]
MDSTNSKACIAVSAPSQSSSKRLLFDRRYGWVFDEWKDPCEEALSGGRGMFCILPIGKALLKTASHSINLAASSVVEVYERPDLFSPESMKSSFSGWLNNISSFVHKPEFNRLAVKGNSMSDSIIYSSHMHIDNRQ